MFKISVYGKGGIGKSTVSSNLSYILSKNGLKVLHVGCDPKHDSTRLLTNGVSQKTFMDSLLDGNEDGIIEKGSNGIDCVECGGSEPGIGCAGKGMISMFNYIEKNTPEDTDVRVCDVLGDVVCGGFSVPMRRKQTDGIILVVSEDFMSLYAANNILRGIKNLNGSECILGIVLNSRSPEDRIRVNEFSNATGLPIIGTIDKSDAFSRAEAEGKTVAELLPDSESAVQLRKLADNVISHIRGNRTKYRAKPLNENAMTQIAAKQKVTDFSAPEVRIKCRFDTVDRERGLTYNSDQAMPACTSHGAVEALLSVKDAAVVLHGPNNCAFLMEYAWMRRSYLMHKGRGEPLPDNLYATGMNANNIFTGDHEILHDTIIRAINDGFKTVFVVLSCTSDTIGTDVGSVISKIEVPGVKIIPVEPDDYFLGSKFGGFRGGFRALNTLVDWTLPVEKGTVSILAFEPNVFSDKDNRSVIKEILDAFGLRLHTIYTDLVSVDDIRRLGTSEYFIQLGIGHFSTNIAQMLLGKDRRPIVLDPPVFMSGIKEWCDALAEATGNRKAADLFVLRKQTELDEFVAGYGDRFRGMKAAFYQSLEAYHDPHIDILNSLGMDMIAKITWVQKFNEDRFRESKYRDIPVFRDVELCHLSEKINELGADIIISADPRTGRIGIPWTGFYVRGLGIEGSKEFVERLDNSLGLKPIQKWKEVRL